MELHAGEEFGFVVAEPVVCAHWVADGEVFVVVFYREAVFLLGGGKSGVDVVGGRDCGV